ncbi:MAG: heparinase II/III domain-containing protein [Alphaproteobacteria bacterium]
MQFNLGKIGVSFVIKSPFLYTNMVRSSKIESFSKTPQFWSGKSEKGDEILQGIFDWAGSKEIDLENPWDEEADCSYSWQEYAHSFEWLYDVRTSTISNGQVKACEWLRAWIKKYEKPSSLIWRSDIVARRLTSLLSNYDYLIANADKKLSDSLNDSLSRHIGHLIFTNGYDCKLVAQRLSALRGLIIGLLATNNTTLDIKLLINDFCQILEDNLHPDGMNKMRSIPVQISFAKDAFMVQSMLHKMAMNVPNVMDNAIIKMLSALKVFVYQDGSFAHFAGASDSVYYVRQIFARYAKKYDVPNQLEDAGFYNALVGKTQVLFDAGNRSNTSYDDAGILSFEMNYNKTRIFVNCGYCPNSDNPLYEACKNTSAHNSITVDNYNAMSIGNQSRITSVTGSMITEEGWTLLQGSHDGFKTVCNSVLKRAIAINEDGTEIKGEDKFEQIDGIRQIVSRFHLHPNVKVWLLSSKREAMLQVGKTGWKFKVSGGEIAIEESFYMDINGSRRKTNQIVLRTSSIAQHIVMRWNLSLQ